MIGGTLSDTDNPKVRDMSGTLEWNRPRLEDVNIDKHVDISIDILIDRTHDIGDD